MALKQRRQGDDQLFNYLRPYGRMAQGNLEDLGFFLEGEEDEESHLMHEFPKPGRCRLAALGLAVGIGIGTLISQTVLEEDVPKSDTVALYQNK